MVGRGQHTASRVGARSLHITSLLASAHTCVLQIALADQAGVGGSADEAASVPGSHHACGKSGAAHTLISCHSRSTAQPACIRSVAAHAMCVVRPSVATAAQSACSPAGTTVGTGKQRQHGYMPHPCCLLRGQPARGQGAGRRAVTHCYKCQQAPCNIPAIDGCDRGGGSTQAQAARSLIRPLSSHPGIPHSDALERDPGACIGCLGIVLQDRLGQQRHSMACSKCGGGASGSARGGARGGAQSLADSRGLPMTSSKDTRQCGSGHRAPGEAGSRQT